MIKKINSFISYLEPENNPLSANVTIIKGDNFYYVYDVGASDTAYKIISSLDKPYIAIISHFHQDHSDNLKRLSPVKIYSGSIIAKRFNNAINVKNILEFNDGISFKIYPIPSSHSKDAIALEIDDKLFVGDAIYGDAKTNKEVYNQQLLKELISCIKGKKEKELYCSHEEPFGIPMVNAIKRLEEIYANRKKTRHILRWMKNEKNFCFRQSEYGFIGYMP